MDRNAPSGVFDSGIGGLTVAREIMRQMPQERIVYFGDTARVPYGSKSQETVLRYSRQIIRFLKTQGVKAIVIACNTASACALETVKQDIEVIGKPCPLFVPLVEEGLFHDSVTDEIASRYLSSLKEKYIDTLVMGCTHYPLLRSTLHRLMGDEVTLVNPAYETAVELKTLLRDMDLTRSSEDLERFSEENSRRAAAGEPILDQYQFFVSDRAENFTRFAKAILPKEVKDTKQINIEEY